MSIIKNLKYLKRLSFQIIPYDTSHEVKSKQFTLPQLILFVIAYSVFLAVFGYYFRGKVEEKIIGSENGAYVSIVKGGVFQAAESTGEYTLVGCSVAPGFDFKDFSFLQDEPEKLQSLKELFPKSTYLV